MKFNPNQDILVGLFAVLVSVLPQLLWLVAFCPSWSTKFCTCGRRQSNPCSSRTRRCFGE